MGHMLGRLFGLFWGCRFEVSVGGVAYYINGRELMETVCVCRTALLLITGDLMVRLEIEDK